MCTEENVGVRHYVEKNMKAMVWKKKRVGAVNRYGRTETHILSWWRPRLGWSGGCDQREDKAGHNESLRLCS